MAGVKVNIALDDAQVKQALNNLVNANQQALYEVLGETLVSSTVQRFKDSKAPDGTTWKTSGASKTLVKAGHLRDSITYNANSKMVEVGSDLVYAAIHQFGGKIKAKTAKGMRFKIGNNWINKQSITMPKRPFLGISAQDKQDINTDVLDWANSVLLGAIH